MQRLSTVGLILITLSLISIIPVTCDGIFALFGGNCVNYEFFYTLMPPALVLLSLGFLFLLKTQKIKLKFTSRSLIFLSIVLFVLLVGILFVSQPIFITVTGLKQQYTINEPIQFSISAIGFGKVCPDPNLFIFRATKHVSTNGSNLIWDYSHPACSNPQYEFFNYSWDLEDITKNPISISESGEFLLSVSFGNKDYEKKFVIE